MKNKIIIPIVFLLILGVIITIFMIDKKQKEDKHYETIINKFEGNLQTYLTVTHPNLSCDDNKSHSMRITGTELVTSGNLKTKDLLDIDGESYCFIYANVDTNKECEFEYKTYMKCENYQTKGYVEWRK